jgi:hypothetical protein
MFLKEQKCQRFSNQVAPPHDNSVATLDRDVLPPQDLDDTGGSAGLQRLFRGQMTGVDRMKTIDIL